MRVTIEKLPSVESAKVSLDEGRAIIQLEAGNAVTIAQLRQSVERNGFTAQQAVVRAEAEVVTKGDTVYLGFSGTSDSYAVASTPQADGILQQLRKSAGQRVLIAGIVPAPKDRRAPPMIQVTRVSPVTR